MREVYPNFYIGDDQDCRSVSKNPDWAIVHACQSCHQRKLEYTHDLPSSHTHYLFLEEPHHLYLNLLDLHEILATQAHPIVQTALSFIDKYLATHQVLIHCNYGASRSPSIAFLYLAKKGVLADNYEQAMKEFTKIYALYHPAHGMADYCKKYWGQF